MFVIIFYEDKITLHNKSDKDNSIEHLFGIGKEGENESNRKYFSDQ